MLTLLFGCKGVQRLGEQQQPVLLGSGRLAPRQPVPPPHKMEEPCLPAGILFVIWKTNASTELSANRCCIWLDPGSSRLWLEARGAILLLFSSAKLLAKGGLSGDNELCEI